MALSLDDIKKASGIMDHVMSSSPTTADEVMTLFEYVSRCTKPQLQKITKSHTKEIGNQTENVPVILQSIVRCVMKKVEKRAPVAIDFSPAKSPLRRTISPLKPLGKSVLLDIARRLDVEVRGTGIKCEDLIIMIMVKLSHGSEADPSFIRTVVDGDSYRCSVSLRFLEKVLTTMPIGWIPEMIRNVIGWMVSDIYMYGNVDSHRKLLENRAMSLQNLYEHSRKGKSRVEMMMEMNRYFLEIGGENEDDAKRNRKEAVKMVIGSIRDTIGCRIQRHLNSLAPVSEDSEKYWLKELVEGKAIHVSDEGSLIRWSTPSTKRFCENASSVQRKIDSDAATDPKSPSFLRPPQLESLQMLRRSMNRAATSAHERRGRRSPGDGEETDLEEEDEVREAVAQLSISAQQERTLQLAFMNEFTNFICLAYTKHEADLRESLAKVEKKWDAMEKMGWERGEKAYLLVLPTGCGKTGVAALIPYVIDLLPGARVLAIAPSLVISDVLEIGIPAFLYHHKYLEKDRIPRVKVLFKNDDSSIEETDLCVATYQSLGLKNLLKLMRNSFDLIIVDEAHHEVSKSYRTIFQYFITARKVFLTATPQRGDSVVVDATRVYSYPVSETIRHKYIKDMRLIEVGRERLRAKCIYGPDQTLSFEEVLVHSKQHWFVKCVENSQACQDTVLSYSIRKLCELRRKSNKPHKMIVFVESREEIHLVAERMPTVIEVGKLRLRVGKIEGGTPKEQRRIVDRVDIIVNCKVLGEGYDNPEVSVVALLKRDMSLLPFLQKIGRGVRWVSEREVWPDEEQVCHVITHAGLRVIDLWEAYRNDTSAEDTPKLEKSSPLFAQVEDNPSGDHFRERITPFLLDKKI
eukprot:TRINITY_DN1203_c1_g1_i1.p1 TRINITY_DN1203_c1_g1~~TRINITY_DN1203_c1_g1_i1.p1  ORF type:complete len:859 (-),score=203.60 TRINITY_DN1203_c1_g1_i1:120-2696(-)